MALRYRRAAKLLAPAVVMTLRAGQIELALPLRKHFAACLQEWSEAIVVWNVDRHAARLLPNISGERTQLLAFERQRGCLLLLRPAVVDARFEVHGSTAHGIEGGIAGRHTPHA